MAKPVLTVYAGGTPNDYVLSRLAVDALAETMRNGHPDDGSDQDDAVRQDAVECLRRHVAASTRKDAQ
jgi:hypothetical protein